MLYLRAQTPSYEGRQRKQSQMALFKELTPSLLRELIEKIVIHEKVRTDEVVFDSRSRPRKPISQQIDIYYNFVGVLG